ncbi:MAG: MoaD/ThiS family protein [Candidatus Korarchaeota archaeon]|nr:MoaD/ThiS family protein [Thermoproteota archaeon]
MRVAIRLYSILKDIVGREEITLDFNAEKLCLYEVITSLLERYPSLSQYIKLNKERKIETKGVSIIVNGRHAIFLGSENTEIRDGYVIDLIPPLHGGYSFFVRIDTSI